MAQRGRRQYAITVLIVTGSVLGFPSSGAARYEPVLHEHYEPDATEDAQLQATTLDGALPLALATRSGAISLRDAKSSVSAGVQRYDSEPSDYVQEYRADPDTRRPELVSYADPFVPTIPPYKRLYAYDAVGEEFELLVARPTLQKLPVGGSARLEDDQFFADFEVQLPRNVAVRIPSVGPDTRVIVVQTRPMQDFELFKDGADNWFAQSSVQGVVQLTLHLAIDRRSFGAEFPKSSSPTLRQFVPQLPSQVAAAAQAVAQEIGIEPGSSPAEIVAALVEHFRSFEASETPLISSGETLYRELSLSKQGVCRHRAYGFVVTALGLGIPARFVRNEAHAWVEVFDGSLWHRIDLGGAALRALLDVGERPMHVEPQDPYPWPDQGTSARTMTERALHDRPPSARTSVPVPDSEQPVTSTPSAPADARAESDLSTSSLTVSVPDRQIMRGSRLRVSGTVTSENGSCDQVRVDLTLTRGSAERYAVGTVMTDGQGHYQGHIVVPFTIPLGDYDVEASTPGRSPVCGPGHSLD